MLDKAPDKDLWPCGGPTLEHTSVPEVLHLMEVTHIEAVHEETQSVGKTDIGEVHRGLSPMERTPLLEQRENGGNPLLRMKEAQRKCVMN